MARKRRITRLLCPAPFVITQWCAGRGDESAACWTASPTPALPEAEAESAWMAGDSTNTGIGCLWLESVSCNPDAVPF